MSDDISSANNSKAITPSNAATYKGARGIYVGVTGDVLMEMAGGAVVLRQNMQQGMTHGYEVVRVLTSGTDDAGNAGTTTADGLILDY